MKKLSTLVLSILTTFIASNLFAQCGPGGCGINGGGYNNGGNSYSGYNNGGYMDQGNSGYMNQGNNGYMDQGNNGYMDHGSYGHESYGGQGDHFNDGGYYGSPSYDSSYGVQYQNSATNAPRPFPRSNNRQMRSQTYSYNNAQADWSHPADDQGHFVADQYSPQYGFADYSSTAQPQGNPSNPSAMGSSNSTSNGHPSSPTSH